MVRYWRLATWIALPSSDFSDATIILVQHCWFISAFFMVNQELLRTNHCSFSASLTAMVKWRCKLKISLCSGVIMSLILNVKQSGHAAIGLHLGQHSQGLAEGKKSLRHSNLPLKKKKDLLYVKNIQKTYCECQNCTHLAEWKANKFVSKCCSSPLPFLTMIS